MRKKLQFNIKSSSLNFNFEEIYEHARQPFESY